MKYVSGRIVWGIYTWVGWNGEVEEPIGSSVPVLTYFIHLPMEMEPIVSSETSAIRTQTPGNYPKRNKLHLEHGESLKTSKIYYFTTEYYEIVVVHSYVSSVVLCGL